MREFQLSLRQQIRPSTLRWRSGEWIELPPGDGRVLGCTCMEEDVVKKHVSVAGVQEGDLLAICDAGAYDSSMAFSFAKGRNEPNSMIDITYILPIRSASLTGLAELTQYLQSLDVAQLSSSMVPPPTSLRRIRNDGATSVCTYCPILCGILRMGRSAAS